VICVVTGHICSGKTTWVSQQARPGDVVIDMDRIAAAIQPEGADPYDHPPHVIEIARAIRWSAIDSAIRFGRSHAFDLWIIHAYPEPIDLARYQRLGAMVEEIRCEPDTLIERTTRLRPPRCLRTLLERLKGGVGSAVKSV